MQANKTSSTFRIFSVLTGMAAHAAMGIAVGLAFALVVLAVDRDHVLSLIEREAALGTTTTELLASVVSIFAIGTTLTGLVFMLTEESESAGR
jgi:hypothetical protein